MKIFQMKINVNACTLENLRILGIYIYFLASWKLPTAKFQPRKFSPIKLSPSKFHLDNSQPKTATWNFLTHVFKCSHPRFLVVYFHYSHHYHWYYLKACFVILCFKSAEVFTFVNICQKQGLSEERLLMKWEEIF